jgi:subtilisin family serine protease
MPNARSLAAPAACRARLVGCKKRRIAVAGAAIAAVLAGSLTAGVPKASASTGEKVIVTATGLLSPAAAVIGVGGALLTQFHLIDGVEAVIPAAIEPVLAALPGITVTPDVSVSVQDTPESTGPHTPSDVFLGQTGATRLAAAGDTGRGVTVAVLDTDIDMTALPAWPTAGCSWSASITRFSGRRWTVRRTH